MVGAGYMTQPVLSVPAPDGAPRSAQPRRLEAHVRMLAVSLAPRDWSHPENLDQVAAYVAGELARAGVRVTEQVYEVTGRRYRNVIASLGPDAGERIVVGAHYDAFGPFPGADDNASGVAGLIELAWLLAASSDLRAGVDLVAYTLEEPPFYRGESMGSWVHAASLRRAGVSVRGMISLEMIGYFADTRGSQQFPHPLLALLYPSTGNFIAVVGKLGQGNLVRRIKAGMRAGADLDVRSLTGPAWMPGVDFSDHWSYWAHGFPAAMVTDTAFYRNERYHTVHDIADSLDYARMAKVVEGVRQAVELLAL
jgi:Zn-dependent M28 family amino/carboxypeptidase